MSELIVIGYDSPAEAEAARQDLLRMSEEYLLEMNDAVVAERDDHGRIRLDQYVTLWTAGAAGGSFWGLLAGLLFLHPLLGVVVGATAGALAGAMTDFGIDDRFMKQVSEELRPGQAALFVMAQNASSERVVRRMVDGGGRVIRTNLDLSQEQRLRQAFAAAHREALVHEAGRAA